MNYRHIYHAGSFADVFKHVLLTITVESLLMKNKPFCYLDTHAGIAKYNLKSVEAKKTREQETGITKILAQPKNTLPKPIKKYVQIVKRLNVKDDLELYPGSPYIVRSLLRPEDRMILTELHPQEIEILRAEFREDKQTAVHLHDGYMALKAFLPPTPRRGLVLIDPPYEIDNEFNMLIKALKMALTRWNEGIYLVWYPIKNTYAVHEFERKLKKLPAAKGLLLTELSLNNREPTSTLSRTGMAIINPPFLLGPQVKEILPWLTKILSLEGQYRIEQYQT